MALHCAGASVAPGHLKQYETVSDGIYILEELAW